MDLVQQADETKLTLERKGLQSSNNMISYLIKALLAITSAWESFTAVPSRFRYELRIQRLPGNIRHYRLELLLSSNEQVAAQREWPNNSNTLQKFHITYGKMALCFRTKIRTNIKDISSETRSSGPIEVEQVLRIVSNI